MVNDLPVIEYAPPMKWYQRRRWRRAALGVIASAALVLLSLVSVETYREWVRHHRRPISQGGGSSHIPDRVFPHIGSSVWLMGSGKLFYAISVAHADFEPMLPAFSYGYRYDIKHGGSLEVNGTKVGYSTKPRMLALNPFAELQEIELSETEAKVVASSDEVAIWDHVVLPRLYRFHGKDESGKRVGRWECFDAAGRKAYDGDYVEGQRDGKWTYYFPSGAVRAESWYANGKRHGSWRTFDASGKVADSLEWQEDWPVGRAARQWGMGFSETKTPRR